MELLIGSHVSFGKESQLIGSVSEALSYGANTFMFYTGAPQNTFRSKVDTLKTKEAYALMHEHGIDPDTVIVHAPYIINLANNAKPESYEFAINFLKQEVERCEELGMKWIVLHPGSYVTLTKEEGIKNIINGLNAVIRKDQGVCICLETMAIKGTEIGTLDDIKEIIDGVTYASKVRVCLDTCHLHDAGYDMSDFDSFLKEFDEKIGIDKIACVHINDSKNARGAHKDRHENFGLGYLGFDTLIRIIYHEKLKKVPKILETPYVTKTDSDKKREYPPYLFEINMIREKKQNPNLIEEIRNYYK